MLCAMTWSSPWGASGGRIRFIYYVLFPSWSSNGLMHIADGRNAPFAIESRSSDQTRSAYVMRATECKCCLVARRLFRLKREWSYGVIEEQLESRRRNGCFSKFSLKTSIEFAWSLDQIDPLSRRPNSISPATLPLCRWCFVFMFSFEFLVILCEK